MTDAFVGNESYAVPGANHAPIVVTPVVNSIATPRQVSSYGVSNVVQVGAANTAVVQATTDPRPVVIQNIGMIPVWITNGAALAPQGRRIGAGETVEMVTSQAIFLCTLALSPAALVPAMKAFVAVTG